jgi:hypothetical protein
MANLSNPATISWKHIGRTVDGADAYDLARLFARTAGPARRISSISAKSAPVETTSFSVRGDNPRAEETPAKLFISLLSKGDMSNFSVAC